MKITKKLSALLLVAVLSFGMAKAQVGIEGGYGSSNYNYDGSKALNGFYIGANYGMSIQGPISLQYGLFYNYATRKMNMLVAEATNTSHSLDIPVRVAFSYPISMLKLTAFVGPNFNIGIANNVKVGDESKSMYDDPTNHSRFNLQLGGGIAAEYGNIGLKVSYDLGMLKLVKESDESKLSTFKVGVFYNF